MEDHNRVYPLLTASRRTCESNSVQVLARRVLCFAKNGLGYLANDMGRRQCPDAPGSNPPCADDHIRRERPIKDHNYQ
jgi:hypothetical protein